MTAFVPDLWVLAAFAAAVFQTLRFMLQKVLATAVLSPAGATFARFFYSAPVILGLLLGYLALTQTELPAMTARFWAYGLTGGAAQVIATICVVTLFKSRSFAVGVTLMKTEVILSVLIGFILLGEAVTVPALLAIALGLAGVLLLSKPPQIAGWGWRAMGNPGVALGLGQAFFLRFPRSATAAPRSRSPRRILSCGPASRFLRSRRRRCWGWRSGSPGAIRRRSVPSGGHAASPPGSG